MNEDYSSLSEEELIKEIQHQLEARDEIDSSDLEFKFEDEQLIVTGGLTSEEEMEGLVHILEDFLDPKDYVLEVEIAETSDRSQDFEKQKYAAPEEEDEDSDELEELEEYDEDEMDEEEEEDAEDEDLEEDDDFDDEKW